MNHRNHRGSYKMLAVVTWALILGLNGGGSAAQAEESPAVGSTLYFQGQGEGPSDRDQRTGTTLQFGSPAHVSRQSRSSTSQRPIVGTTLQFAAPAPAPQPSSGATAVVEPDEDQGPRNK